MALSPAAGVDDPRPANSSEFLQPHSMMTPGALGALAMVGTNAITFRFPEIDPRYVVAALSLLFGFAAVIKSGSIPTKILFYVLNSIIIFSVAAGANTVGQAAAGTQAPQRPGFTWLDLTPIPPAYAASAPQPTTGSFFKPWFSTPQAVPGADQTAWYVIVGSYSSQEAAQKAADDINTRFPNKYNARAVKSTTTEFWAVRIGDDSTLSDAVTTKEQADADKVSGDSFIRKRAH